MDVFKSKLHPQIVHMLSSQYLHCPQIRNRIARVFSSTKNGIPRVFQANERANADKKRKGIFNRTPQDNPGCVIAFQAASISLRHINFCNFREKPIQASLNYFGLSQHSAGMSAFASGGCACQMAVRLHQPADLHAFRPSQSRTSRACRAIANMRCA